MAASRCWRSAAGARSSTWRSGARSTATSRSSPKAAPITPGRSGTNGGSWWRRPSTGREPPAHPTHPIDIEADSLLGAHLGRARRRRQLSPSGRVGAGGGARAPSRGRRTASSRRSRCRARARSSSACNGSCTRSGRADEAMFGIWRAFVSEAAAAIEGARHRGGVPMTASVEVDDRRRRRRPGRCRSGRRRSGTTACTSATRTSCLGPPPGDARPRLVIQRVPQRHAGQGARAHRPAGRRPGRGGRAPAGARRDGRVGRRRDRRPASSAGRPWLTPRAPCSACAPRGRRDPADDRSRRGEVRGDRRGRPRALHRVAPGQGARGARPGLRRGRHRARQDRGSAPGRRASPAASSATTTSSRRCAS